MRGVPGDRHSYRDQQSGRYPLLAQVSVSKYGDHLPLYRQEGMYRRHGVELSRKTMCGWMRQCAELLRPLLERMKQRALSSKAMRWRGGHGYEDLNYCGLMRAACLMQ